MYFQPFIISLAFHLILVLLLQRAPESLLKSPPTTVDIVFREVEPSAPKLEEDQKQMVRDTGVESVDTPKKKPRFYSAKDTVVFEEMRAAQSGLTRNLKRGALVPPLEVTKPTGGKRSSEIAAAAKARNSSDSQRDADAKGAQGKTEESSARANSTRVGETGDGKPLVMPGGVSTVGERLPEDIKIGEMTSLNTERFRYYTFFSRIEEKIRHRWEDKVREAAFGIRPERLGHREWITHIEVLLDPKGHFKTALIKQASGIPGFDRAPVEAFQEASPYLNPPAEMIQDDGLIHLNYSLSVNWTYSVAR